MISVYGLRGRRVNEVPASTLAMRGRHRTDQDVSLVVAIAVVTVVLVLLILRLGSKVDARRAAPTRLPLAHGMVRELASAFQCSFPGPSGSRCPSAYCCPAPLELRRQPVPQRFSAGRVTRFPTSLMKSLSVSALRHGPLSRSAGVRPIAARSSIPAARRYNDPQRSSWVSDQRWPRRVPLGRPPVRAAALSHGKPD